MKNLLLSLWVLFMLSLSACDERLELSEDGVLVPLTVMEDPSLPVININGVKLHSEAFGNPEDEMIVVLHGGPGADYRSQLNYKQLTTDGFYVVFYDQRGAGLSQRLDESGFTKVQVYIDELYGVIQHYRHDDVQKIILAGHSWGAMLAVAYINQLPENIHGVILTEPGGFTWEQTEEYILRTIQIKVFTEATNDYVYKDQFITASEHKELDYKMALSLSGYGATGDSTPPPFWRYGSIASSASIETASNNPALMDFTTHLNEYPQKVLFAYSENNEAYGKEHAKLLAASLSNVELIEIKGCGHEIPVHGWTNFYPVVQKYLEEIK